MNKSWSRHELEGNVGAVYFPYGNEELIFSVLGGKCDFFDESKGFTNEEVSGFMKTYL